MFFQNQLKIAELRYQAAKAGDAFRILGIVVVAVIGLLTLCGLIYCGYKCYCKYNGYPFMATSAPLSLTKTYQPARSFNNREIRNNEGEVQGSQGRHGHRSLQIQNLCKY